MAGGAPLLTNPAVASIARSAERAKGDDQGRLTRPHGEHHTARGETDPIGRRFFGDGDAEIISPCSGSQKSGHPDGAGRARLGDAQPGRDCLTVGATKPHHLRCSGDLDAKLTDDEIAVIAFGNCFGDHLTNTASICPPGIDHVLLRGPLGGCEPQITGTTWGQPERRQRPDPADQGRDPALPFFGYPRTLNAINAVNEIIRPTTSRAVCEPAAKNPLALEMKHLDPTTERNLHGATNPRC